VRLTKYGHSTVFESCGYVAVVEHGPTRLAGVDFLADRPWQQNHSVMEEARLREIIN